MSKVIRSLVLPLALVVAAAAGTDSAVGQDRTKQDKTKQDKAKAKPPAPTASGTVVFELYKDSRGDYRFRLKDGDTELAMSHKGYKSKEDIEKVIDTIKSSASRAKLNDESK